MRLFLPLMLAPLTTLAAVSLKPLEEIRIFPIHTVAAEVVSQNDSTLSAELSARIERIAVRPGESVKTGQLLVALDCRDSHSQQQAIQAQQQQTRAQLDYARAQQTRLRTLQGKELVAASQREQADAEAKRLSAQLAGLQVQLQQAERQISRCTITAPYNGVVREQLAGVGSLASPGTPLLRLTQTEGAEIRAHVPLTLLPAVQTHPVIFSATSIDDIRVSPLRQSRAVEPSTRTVASWFRTDFPLPIGLAGTLSLTDATPHIPATYLVRRGEQLGIFIREDGKARFMPLPLAQEGRPAALPPSWQGKRMAVVVDGYQRLNDGDPLP